MRRYLNLGFRLAILVAAVLMGSMAFHGAEEPKAGGKIVYSRRCVMCHGPEGKGFPALHTPDFTDPKWQASITDQEMVTVIKEGKKDTAMKGFADKLTDDEINALVTYIRTLDSSKKK